MHTKIYSCTHINNVIINGIAKVTYLGGKIGVAPGAQGTKEVLR